MQLLHSKCINNFIGSIIVYSVDTLIRDAVTQTQIEKRNFKTMVKPKLISQGRYNLSLIVHCTE